MRALLDQPPSQREHARISRGRTGFDHHQRVAGFLPHGVSKRGLLGVAHFADDIAGDHKIRRRCIV